MPWSNQSGDNGGPWGSHKPSNPHGNVSQQDLEKIIKSIKNQFKQIFPFGFNGGVPLLIIAFFLIFWGSQSIYTVQPDERAVEMRFGKPKKDIYMPGLHLMLWPIDNVEIVKVIERQKNIGGERKNNSTEGLMLSGDQNIVNVQFSVLYMVNDPRAYLFNVENPTETLKQVAESAMREVVGRRPALDIFRANRQQVSLEVKNVIQDTLNIYKSGILINAVSIEDAAPPREVADAFDEVQRAEQDEDRFVEEANKYKNQKLGLSRGEAARIRESSIAYKNRVVKEAEGEAERFISIYNQYLKAPDITRQRIYIETMEEVLKKSNKIIIDNNQSVIPYLPLNEVFPQIRKKVEGGTRNVE
ncbi:HflK protein [Liberibacter crescens BT-1]|uniref:Protein HflK n=1 Tax=Liberibacter crescens (strain BT-1) TaxID=1215343 RepID=L0EVE6_LIBCB|nr:FtsH protease activity modulator HflK [Liberibacter crescens]AGA64628.1 HflK protein [Liberibacter crescens BT-1]AMC12742.1 tail fiber protein [Liberibacter crescens]